MKTVTPDQFDEEVKSILDAYSKKVIDASKDAVKESAKTCKEKIQANVSKAGIQGTGEYRDSWRAELESQTATETVYRVYAQAPYYRLTHLLEYGHQIWVHGKYLEKKTRKFAHIRPAVRDLKNEFATKLKVGLKK